MRTPPAQFRFRAVSMELAAQLDAQRVDMLIVAADGTSIAVEFEKDAILKVQRHIGKIARDCPQIARWREIPGATHSTLRDESDYETAVSEGWSIAASTAVAAWRSIGTPSYAFQ